MVKFYFGLLMVFWDEQTFVHSFLGKTNTSAKLRVH